MLKSFSGVRKALAVTLTAATLGLGFNAVTSHEAEARYRGGRGGAVAAGIIGGIAAGALIAGAARPAYGYGYGGGYGYHGGYYGGGYAPVGGYGYYAAPVYAPACYWQRQRVWLSPYEYTFRRVRVCQ